MPQVFTNAMIFLGGLEVTGQFNQATLEYSAESLDETPFGASTRQRRGGLKDARATGRGYYRSASVNEIDPNLFDGVGVADEVLSLYPDGITEGSTSTGAGYAFKVTESRFRLGGAVGEILPFEFEAEGRGVGAT